jgi:hypothetical protein
MREHLVAVLELDLEVARGQHLDHPALEFYVLFSAHEREETYSLAPPWSTTSTRRARGRLEWRVEFGGPFR